MLSQTEYLAFAKKVIRRYGRPIMLKDDEAIGEIVNYIIKGDLRYDAAKGMNPNSWRMLNGRYGVLVYLAKRARQKQLLSLDEVGPVGNTGFMQSVYINEIVDLVKNDQSLTDRERAVFHDRHMDLMTLRQIGERHQLTRERIRQILENIYKKIRLHYEN